MTVKTKTTRISIYDDLILNNLIGYNNNNLKYLANTTGAKVSLMGYDVVIFGRNKAVEKCEYVFSKLANRAKSARLKEEDYSEVLSQLNKTLPEGVIIETKTGYLVKPKTNNQKDYVQAIADHDITFGIGMAGTGKTFLATMLGLKGLLDGEYERLILTRPAVEAGENLGFLKGDLLEKLDPYLRPLYDALFEVIDPDKFKEYMEKGKIEVAPVGFMRGRTFNNSFIIVDEAQNTTTSQMKMILTRMGFKSKMVITGDVTQTDLPNWELSGLNMAQRILKDIDGIKFCHLGKGDVVRHPLVHKIAIAYDDFYAPEKMEKPKMTSPADLWDDLVSFREELNQNAN